MDWLPEMKTVAPGKLCPFSSTTFPVIESSKLAFTMFTDSCDAKNSSTASLRFIAPVDVGLVGLSRLDKAGW